MFREVPTATGRSERQELKRCSAAPGSPKVWKLGTSKSKKLLIKFAEGRVLLVNFFPLTMGISRLVMILSLLAGGTTVVILAMTLLLDASKISEAIGVENRLCSNRLATESERSEQILEAFEHMSPFIFPQLYRCKIKIEDLPAEDIHASQSREDIWLFEKIFSLQLPDDLVSGKFIEIGALDGRTFSNTLYFEKKWDWRGILIEGHPANQPALRAAQDFRKNAAIFTVAICAFTDDKQVGNLSFTSGGGAVGASVSHASEQFLKGWHGGVTEGSTLFPKTDLIA